MKKVLLINLNNIEPPVAPIGLEYVSSYLLQKGFEVEIYDINTTDISLEEKLTRSSPDIVGITVRNTDDSCYNTQEFFVDEIKRAVSICKKEGLKVVLGGVGFSIYPDEVLNYTSADWGVYGDGEYALAEILSSKSGDKIVKKTFKGFKEFSPLREIINNKFYYQKGGMVGIEATRGCNRKCIYCADPIAKGRKVRFRNVKKVVDELFQLIEKGIYHFHFCDSEFNLSLDYAKELCSEMIKRKLEDKARWYAYGVPDMMDKELAGMLRKAGCEGINFGIDHTADGMLKFLKKGFNYSTVKHTVKLLKREGIKVMIDLLLGAPGETPESVRNVIRDMKILSPFRVGVAYGLRVYPKTPLFRFLKNKGIKTPSNLLKPFFYLSEKVKDCIEEIILEETRDDIRFFTNLKEEARRNYNYNSNELIKNAIQNGLRGAFWDILAKVQENIS